MINLSFYFIRNPIFSVAENRDFGRFVTTWYSVHCKHTRFFEFLGLLNEFFLEEAWFWGVRVGFGGREGALASALISHKTKGCDIWPPLKSQFVKRFLTGSIVLYSF